MSNTICARAMNNGIPTAIATGVPTLVDAPIYEEGLADGIPALRVGGPDMSEFEEAITDRMITPPGLKPTSKCAMYPRVNAMSP